MAMSVFAPNMSPITENLPVSAAEVQPLIGSSASERNLRELIKSPIVAPTVEELASHPSTTDSSLSTITNISKAQQITSSDSFITISLQEQIAKALVLPRLKRHHAMPAYFSVKDLSMNVNRLTTQYLNQNSVNSLALSTYTTVYAQRQTETLWSNRIGFRYLERENDAQSHAFVRQSCDIDNIRSRLGRASINDDKITSSAMAPLARAKNFWEPVCIEDEKVPASNAGTTLANIRGLLDVPTAVLIRHKVDYPLLKTHLKPLNFLKGVVAYIICDFTFLGSSAFGDDTIL
ncbi:hypothetical protein BPOR_0242g00120 [Botrytis porri]|uniref:Uncharacterized protein n=1 Tax=Botrytis porri TaxID=87229 RepID=A0A4Z1KRR6_9HELO|nr:hypothetical protein BPOR_0242g00120 [Botrytis porri]